LSTSVPWIAIVPLKIEAMCFYDLTTLRLY
jgi:hypothetical protein